MPARAALITALILDCPMCLPCIAEKALVTEKRALTALVAIGEALVVPPRDRAVLHLRRDDRRAVGRATPRRDGLSGPSWPKRKSKPRPRAGDAPQPEQLVFPFELRVGDVILEEGAQVEVVGRPTAMSNGKTTRFWVLRAGEEVFAEPARFVGRSTRVADPKSSSQ